MQYAKSMYLCGELVQAEDCDFESSKELGLTCPFCSQAVFLRAGHIRTIQGKEVIINAAFAHYHTGVDDFDCEQRSLSKEGREFLKMRTIEARNQRLELYNKHLWEMISRDRNINRSVYLRTKKTLGSAFLTKRTREVREWLSNNHSLVYKLAWDAYTLPNYKDIDLLNTGKPVFMSEQEFLEEIKDHEEYLSAANLKLDRLVSQEVLEFLCTRTGGYTLEKLTAMAFVIGFRTDRTLPQDMDARLLSSAVIGIVVGTHWTEILRDRLS